MIPLFIDGKVSVDGLSLDIEHYYQISRKCDIKVSEGAKLVGLVLLGE